MDLLVLSLLFYSHHQVQKYNYLLQLYIFASDLCVASGDISLSGISSDETNTLHSAALFDVDRKKVDFSYQMFDKIYPASTTKIMTALLALENSNLDDQVTFTEECLADQTSDSGNIGMQVGEVLTMRQCLLALMIRSANDVATQIAVQIAGSVAAFADMMNQKAQELGCVTGPKQLGVFGASYLYPVFLRLGIIYASAG